MFDTLSPYKTHFSLSYSFLIIPLISAYLFDNSFVKNHIKTLGNNPAQVAGGYGGIIQDTARDPLDNPIYTNVLKKRNKRH
jgi:hypothetical protein